MPFYAPSPEGGRVNGSANANDIIYLLFNHLKLNLNRNRTDFSKHLTPYPSGDEGIKPKFVIHLKNQFYLRSVFIKLYPYQNISAVVQEYVSRLLPGDSPIYLQEYAVMPVNFH